MQREKIQLIRDGLETAYVNGNTASELLYKPHFVSNNHNEGKKVLSVIEDELLKCDKFQISVAFITLGGVTPLLQTLKELEKREIPGEILTSNYLDFSEPQALEKLNSLKNIRIKMYDTNSAKNGFHTKGYIFKEEEVYRIIIGSSNMTSAALTTNREWNTKLVSTSQGEVAEDILKEFGQFFPKVTDADMKLISQPLDFFGQNIYNAVTVRAGEDGKAVRAARYDGFPQTAIGWPVTPEVLYWAPKFMQERYKKPFMITENGMASHDWVGVDGKVHDQARVDFMARYLGAYKRAAEDGVDLAGYFAWSVMDNFEWAYGYSQRFGLVYTDYNTQKRTWKDSAYFYKNIIETNGENL